MRNLRYYTIIIGLCTIGLVGCTSTPTHETSNNSAEYNSCLQAGPQAPRDIDQLQGTNPVLFSTAPDYTQMNLCNIHFHENTEHRARAYPIPAKAKPGIGGYQCTMSKTLTAAELSLPERVACDDIQPGDTIEVHWVHSSCTVTPGPTLGACLSKSCANPNLRVESQAFTLVNDPNAINFADLDTADGTINGYYQAKAIPNNTGKPVEFLGSTTGPKYNNHNSCSPYQVTWSVRPDCAKLDINSLHKWCEQNAFDEDHPHGSRLLVTDPALLSDIPK